MRTFLFALLLGIVALPVQSKIEIDGVVFDYDKVTITCTPGTVPDVTDTPDVPDEPEDSVTPPIGSQDINWAQPGGRETVEEYGGTQSWSFRSTSNPNYGGYINIAETAGQEHITRRVWISKTRAGTAIASRCARKGTGLISIPWLQREYSGACSLEPETQYYLNVRQFGCSGMCPYYRSIPTNGKP